MNLDKHIKRLANGDKAAFEQIYTNTQKAVYYTALSVLRDRALAEDVMQSTYLKVITNAHRYELGTNAVAWILRITRNEALNTQSRRQRETPVDECADDGIFGHSSPDDYGLLIDAARKTLDEEQFRIVMLITASGYKRKEIARMLDLPVSTVTWKYNQATEKLRKVLSDNKGGANNGQ